jgi:UDP-3-O-[3-hydroxymyristoyl] glucosamine N-acyltransferase
VPEGPPLVSLGDVQRAIGGELIGAGEVTLSGVSSLEGAGPQDLAYVTADRYVSAAVKCKAGAFVTHRPLPELRRPHLVVPEPAHAVVMVIRQFFTVPFKPRGIADQIARGADVRIGPDPSIWPFVTLGDRATLGARVTLYPGVFVGDDVTIGDDSVLFPNVAVLERCRIGRRVRIHGGSVIGSDGFGYVQHAGRHQRVPQRGIVVIEDDVELGANVTIDRATFGETVVKRGTKVDNLVQIAHNVSVGEDSILVAQSGIAGSSSLGHHVVMGGQAGIGDHLTIGDGTMIAARSGVGRHTGAGQIVSGNPAIPHTTALRVFGVIPHLPELRQQVRDLERRVHALEAPPPARTPRHRDRKRAG